MTTRKQYSKEFKLDAVSLVLEQDYSRAEAARNLGINANMLGRWVKEHKAEEERQMEEASIEDSQEADDDIDDEEPELGKELDNRDVKA